MRKQLITLGIIGFLLAPVRYTLHGTHIVLEELSLGALQAELKLAKEYRDYDKVVDKARQKD